MKNHPDHPEGPAVPRSSAARAAVEGGLRPERGTAQRSRVEGFTLLEVLVASAIMALVLTVAISVMISSTASQQVSAIAGAQEGQAMRVLDDISDNIRQADLATVLSLSSLPLPEVTVGALLPGVPLPGLLPAPGNLVSLLPSGAFTSLAFQRVTGFDNVLQVNLLNANPVIYLHLPESGELPNGIDDNGNGLIDEGVILKTSDDPVPLPVVLTHGVARQGEPVDGIDNNGNGLIDEPGFAVVQKGKQIILSLTLENLDSNGRIIATTRTTSGTIRN